MDIKARILRRINLKNIVHIVNINATGHHIRANKEPFLDFSKLLNHFISLLLLHLAVNIENTNLVEHQFKNFSIEIDAAAGVHENHDFVLLVSGKTVQ